MAADFAVVAAATRAAGKAAGAKERKLHKEAKRVKEGSASAAPKEKKKKKKKKKQHVATALEASADAAAAAADAEAAETTELLFRFWARFTDEARGESSESGADAWAELLPMLRDVVNPFDPQQRRLSAPECLEEWLEKYAV